MGDRVQVWADLSSWGALMAGLRFHKRNGRGNEFRYRMRVAELVVSGARPEPKPPYYLTGPFVDGAFAICETSSASVVRMFADEAELLGKAGGKS